MTGTYLLIAAIGICFALWPDDTSTVFTSVSLKIQIFYINYRMKYMAWRMHRALTKLSKEAGYPLPGPFRFVNLWDRENP